VRRRLDAWKEIAQYLGRDVTTVRRWEKREGLPVHRHLHDKLGSVYAYADEIDAWSARRSVEPAPAAPAVSLPEPELVLVAGASRIRWSAVWRLAAGALVAMGVIVAAMTSPWAPRPHAGKDPVIRFALAPPPGTVVEALAISPDSDHVVFAAQDSDGMRLWVQRLDSATAQLLTGTEGASYPFWSPDGQHLGFFAGGWLKRVALSTREVRDIAPAPNGHGGTWNERGDIVFAANSDAPLSHVSASGGPVTAVTVLGHEFKEGHGWPEFLPDGRRFLYTDYSADPARYGIHVMDLETNVSKRLLKVYSSASYSRDGYLLFVKDSLLAQPFDLARLELTGAARPVAEHVRQRYDLGFKSDFSVSHKGLIAARSAGVDQNRLAWIDRRTGRETASLSEPSWYSNPTLSPDGTKLLATLSSGGPSDNLWMFEKTSPAPRRITSGTWDTLPVWSPSGDRVVFRGATGLLEQSLVDGGDAKPVLPAKMLLFPESWSRHYMTVSTLARGTRSDIWAWKLDEPKELFPVVKTEAQEGQSQISPDGRYVAYASDESGQFEVYVQTFPTPTRRWQVSVGGGADPRWRNAQELFYVGADRWMKAVRTTLQPAFAFGRAVPLFETQLDQIWLGDTRNHYDVTPDGQRFVVLAPKTDRRLAPFTVLINWQPPSPR